MEVCTMFRLRCFRRMENGNGKNMRNYHFLLFGIEKKLGERKRGWGGLSSSPQIFFPLQKEDKTQNDLLHLK